MLPTTMKPKVQQEQPLPSKPQLQVLTDEPVTSNTSVVSENKRPIGLDSRNVTSKCDAILLVS